MCNEIRVERERDEYRLVLDRIMFSGQSDFLDFATQVKRELQRTLEKWTPERYLREWEYPFPEEAHQRLREAIATHVSKS